MEPGRYDHPPRWQNTSASEGYDSVQDRNYRDDGSYDLRRLLEERHARGPYHQDIVERENHPPPPATDPWQQSRRRYVDDYSRRPEKPYEDSYHEMDSSREANKYHDVDRFQGHDKFRDSRSIDNYHDHGFDRPARYGERRHEDYMYDDYDYRSPIPNHDREESRERDYDYARRSHDSDHDRTGRRDGSCKRRDSRDRGRESRDMSRERDRSPYRKPSQSRSRSRSYDDRKRSRSPRSRSRGRSCREDSYEDVHHDRNEKRREREDRRQHDHCSVAPSATVVLKGLSQKTTEENLYQILAEWGPLRHVRVIKERNSGISRGFAFIDFPSVDAAQSMMNKLGDEGLVVDGRNVLFEYSSKPTGGGSGSYGLDGGSWSGHTHHKGVTVASDWMCIICGCVNFARRTSCFQCNEPRPDDAPPADIGSSNSAHLGKRGEVGPTHVLVVRGLDDNADEDMLRYEFAKHAPIKDIRLVRDKFTHVSRGFAFLHFYSVEDATKALEGTNGMTLEKNGQILRVAYAKSIMGPGSGSGASQSSSLAAAAIEAATFSQQYDAVGWAPKEYNPDEKQADEPPEQDVAAASQNNSSAPQSGFVWDEASGYYYDAASGFYYDGNTGLYYDGNNGIWYTFDNQSQQYIPCTDQKSNSVEKKADVVNVTNVKKAVISAPAATITSSEKAASLPDAVQAAAAAAIAAEKKEKEKAKEIKLASKSSLLANKKKMSNVLSMWKQRNNEGQQPRVALIDKPPSIFTENRSSSAGLSSKNKFKSEALMRSDNSVVTSVASVQIDSQERLPVSNRSGGTVAGVIRSSGIGVVKSDTLYAEASGSMPTSANIATTTAVSSSVANEDVPSNLASYRTNSSALGSYAPAAGSGRRRFSEMPQQPASASQMTYRDRAAERRTLYGSTSSLGDDMSEHGQSGRDSAFRRSVVDSMPFPPGVGGGRVSGDAVSQSFDIITADRAIDEHNVGNRMLRSMGWHEGSGLGKDGSGAVEPVQAQGTESRAGLGIHQPKKSDPALEVQAGDSYRNIIQKKAIARFREMS